MEYFRIILQFIILLIQGIILVIPFLGSKALYDKRKKLFSRFSSRGYAFISLVLLLFILSLIQNYISEKLSNLKDSEFRKELVKRDSLNQSKSELQAFKTKEMLAKYGYMVDTKNDEIVNILKDKNFRKTTIINGEYPVLDICEIVNDSITRDKVYFSISFCAKDATCYKIKIKLDVMIITDNNQIDFIAKGLVAIPVNTMFIKDFGITPQVFLDKSYLAKSKLFFFRVYGTYEKFDKTLIQVDRFYSYGVGDKKPFGIPNSFADEILRQQVK